MTDKLITLFSDILELEPEKINDQTSPENTQEWDSLTAMHLVAAIEMEFNVHLNTSDIEKMRSIGKVREVLKEKGTTI